MTFLNSVENRAGPRYISVDASTPNAVTLIRKLAIYYSGIEATGTKQDDCTNGPVSESKSGKSDVRAEVAFFSIFINTVYVVSQNDGLESGCGILSLWLRI